MSSLSRMNFYSVGIVAVNKKLSEHFVEITPIEDSPYLDGEISDNKEEYEAKSKGFDGNEWETKIDTTASIRAKWLPMGNSNRKTAPDVRRGEVVAIYRFGDVDEFYWVTLLQDNHIRRLETVIYSFSNNRKENIPDDAETTYYMEVSTHKKLIHLHTSKNDEEPFTYDIQINTKDGVITITDDVDNYIFLDSKNTRIKLHNHDTSYIDMNKKKITIHSLERIDMITKDFSLKASKSATVETPTYLRKTTTDTLNTSKYSITASNYTCTSSTIVYTGAFSQTGGFTNDDIDTGAISAGSYSGGHHL